VNEMLYVRVGKMHSVYSGRERVCVLVTERVREGGCERQLTVG